MVLSVKNKLFHKTWVLLFSLFIVLTSFHAHEEINSAEQGHPECQVCSFHHQPALHAKNVSFESLKLALIEKSLFVETSCSKVFSYLSPNLRAPPLFLSI